MIQPGLFAFLYLVATTINGLLPTEPDNVKRLFVPGAKSRKNATPVAVPFVASHPDKVIDQENTLRVVSSCEIVPLPIQFGPADELKVIVLLETDNAFPPPVV